MSHPFLAAVLDAIHVMQCISFKSIATFSIVNEITQLIASIVYRCANQVS
jgi:hypothetical protein